MADERVLSVHVMGRVQGVWFRAWTRREASRLGIRGWVRNEPDGTVSALIAGPGDAVDTMVAAMRNGPEHARVDWLKVGVSEEVPPKEFEIRR